MIYLFCTILSEVWNKWFSAKAHLVLESIVPSLSVWNECFGVTHGKTHTPKSSVLSHLFATSRFCSSPRFAEQNLHAWNILNRALKIVMTAISFASVEQNRTIFSSFSWLLDDRRRRIAIFEGKCLLLNSFKFVTLLQPTVTHLFSILWPTTSSELLSIRPRTLHGCMLTRSPSEGVSNSHTSSWSQPFPE